VGCTFDKREHLIWIKDEGWAERQTSVLSTIIKVISFQIRNVGLGSSSELAAVLLIISQY